MSFCCRNIIQFLYVIVFPLSARLLSFPIFFVIVFCCVCALCSMLMLKPLFPLFFFLFIISSATREMCLGAGCPSCVCQSGCIQDLQPTIHSLTSRLCVFDKSYFERSSYFGYSYFGRFSYTSFHGTQTYLSRGANSETQIQLSFVPEMARSSLSSL
jgi:hypothetical protein